MENKERTCLFIHSYLSDRHVPNKPDRLTRLSLLSAAELYRHGVVDDICISVVPELSKPMVKRLKSLVDSLQDSNLIIDPVTVTTKQEVTVFKKVIETNKYAKIFSVANESHIPRIKRLIDNIFDDNDVQVMSTEDVLGKYPRYSGIINDSKSWSEQKSLIKQENILNKFARVPIIGNFLSTYLPEIVPNKIIFQKWLFGRFEKK